MAEATDEQLLEAIMKLRAARKAHTEAFKAKDTVEREYRSVHQAYDAALHSVSVARNELERLMGGTAV